MNYKKCITLLIHAVFLTSCHNLIAVLSVSQYKPDSFFQQPYFSQEYFVTIDTIVSGGFATHAYNQNSQSVPYLQQFGSETFLKNFVDTSLLPTNTENFGQGQLSGKFHAREAIVSCYKNINHGFFIEAATVIQDLLVNEISIEYVENQDTLTPEQVDYLDILQQKIPSSIDSAGMFTTCLYAGYSKTYSDFKHLDFIDFTVKTGLTTPQAMHHNNSSNLLQFPFNENKSFGYPVIAAVCVGILDWMNLGWSGSVTPWQKTTKTIPLSTIGNNLLIPDSDIATIQQGPLLTTCVYFQADHLCQGFSTMVGYYFAKNYQYTITPINSVQFPQESDYQSQRYNPWSLGSIYFECDIDFASQLQPNAPVIKAFINIPVNGQLSNKTNMFGGSCNIQISYIF